MDRIIKAETIGKYLIEIKVEEFTSVKNHYYVSLDEETDNLYYGTMYRPVLGMHYSITDRKKANATYNRYRAKAKKGGF